MNSKRSANQTNKVIVIGKQEFPIHFGQIFIDFGNQVTTIRIS